MGTPSVIAQTVDTVLSVFPKMGVSRCLMRELQVSCQPLSREQKFFSGLNEARLQLGLLRELHAMASNRSYIVLQLI
jgi:hypothetical protein